MFKASCCALPEIPVRAEKPMQKTKKNNKVAVQRRFNRDYILIYNSSILILCYSSQYPLTADITSRANHPPLEGHGFLAMGDITGPILHLKNFTSTMLHPGGWKEAAAHQSHFSLPSWPIFSPFSPFLCFISPLSLDCRAMPAPCHSGFFLGR